MTKVRITSSVALADTGKKTRSLKAITCSVFLRNYINEFILNKQNTPSKENINK